jgi:hypothetical protein
MRRCLTAAVATAFVVVSAAAGATPGYADVSAPAQQTVPAGHSDSGTVVSRHRAPDGTVIETSYTPAPGVTPAELARGLAARGVRGVTVLSGAGDVNATVAACSYGTARTWPTTTTCFARWSYNGHTRPQMYFRDRSNDLWPVGRAVAKWNETSGIDSWYRDFDLGCPSTTVHCVTVYNAAYGTAGEWAGVVGKTVRALNSAETYYTGAYIALNESYGGTTYERWNTACKTIGSVLGLGANISTGSCLYYARTSQIYPHSDDFTLLERYY